MKSCLSDNPLFSDILQFSQKNKVDLYLVGGYLRDIFLNRERENPDVDFALRRGSINFSRKLKEHLRCGFVVLDKERGVARLVKKIEGKSYTLDFTDFRGKTLDEDLRLRDFTINALALDFKYVNKNIDLSKCVIDPYGGLKDLKSRTLRMVDKRSFDDDPLRILRAFSLSAIFNLKIDKETLKSIKIKKNKLKGVSQERIRDELFKILDVSCAAVHLEKMDSLRILSLIFPEIEIMRGVSQGPYHHLDVWKHTLETIRQLEKLIEDLRRKKEIQRYLDENICAERKRRSLLKLGALLHDIGKPATKKREEGKTKFHGHERVGMLISKEIAERLRLSNDEFDALRKMVFWHLRPGYLADNEEVTARAYFRYFRDTGNEGVSVLLLSLADQRATKGPLTSEEERAHHEKVAFELIDECLRRQKEKKPARLITGDDVMKKLKLEPSPLIGKILAEIEELQAIGKIKDKKEAFSAAHDIIAKKP